VGLNGRHYTCFTLVNQGSSDIHFNAKSRLWWILRVGMCPKVLSETDTQTDKSPFAYNLHQLVAENTRGEVTSAEAHSSNSVRRSQAFSRICCSGMSQYAAPGEDVTTEQKTSNPRGRDKGRRIDAVRRVWEVKADPTKSWIWTSHFMFRTKSFTDSTLTIKCKWCKKCWMSES